MDICEENAALRNMPFSWFSSVGCYNNAVRDAAKLAAAPAATPPVVNSSSSLAEATSLLAN
jgi:hypothetical protein